MVHVTDLNNAQVREFLESKCTNLSKHAIEHVRKPVGNRILHLQEVAAKTEALTQKKPTERELLVLLIDMRMKDRAHWYIGFLLGEFQNRTSSNTILKNPATKRTSELERI